MTSVDQFWGRRPSAPIHIYNMPTVSTTSTLHPLGAIVLETTDRLNCWYGGLLERTTGSATGYLSTELVHPLNPCLVYSIQLVLGCGIGNWAATG